ncbi:sigma-70 family RNA polymerase sigma factor [Deferrisoma camini]|uniref:sigma-70 family RNA polymerase sigma factor n=1 Tax=Deferrisoma camini TaxID=1035120 RepID=UPI00046D5F51|nr:sigma-70 family RNA polymerase sigma factor [Deferrisoma camini]
MTGGGDRTLPDPSEWVERYGDLLYRYALARLADPDAARDVVQETLLSAVKGRTSFGGRADPRTWLVGILKHKIVDHLRRIVREAPAGDGDPEAEWFDSSGRWRNPTGTVTEPDRMLDSREFWRALRRCLAGLPRRQAAAFVLRELEGMDTAGLCQELGITATNAWVLLHRARLGLRRCLEKEWGRVAEEPNR